MVLLEVRHNVQLGIRREFVDVGNVLGYIVPQEGTPASRAYKHVERIDEDDELDSAGRHKSCGLDGAVDGRDP